MVSEPVHVLFVTAPSDRADRGPPATAGDRRGRAARRPSSRPTSARRVALPDRAGDRAALADGAVLDHVRVQRRVPRRHPPGGAAGPAGPLGHAAIARVLHRRRPGARTTSARSSPARAPSATLNGLYLVDGTQHVDNHMRVDHAAPHATSHELYKGILDGAARGVFNGRIIVDPGAQKTDAKQTNRNLLLSRTRAGQHEAAARDLRRRRQVHPRRDDRPARRGRALLPALARHRRGRGREPADLRLRQRPGRPGPGRAGADRARGVPLPPPAPGRAGPRGRVMTGDRRSRDRDRDRAGVRRRRGPRATSPPCTSGSTASRSSTSTTPPPRRSRGR